MKIKSKLLVIASLSLAVPSSLWAQSDIRSSNNQIDVQYVISDLNYMENSGNAKFDSEKGWIPGYGVSASIMKNLLLGNDYLKVEYSSLSGNTDYRGAIQGQSYGTLLSKSSAQLTDYDVRYGKGLEIGEQFGFKSDQFMLTPYVELGSHQWKRGVNYGETYSNDYYGFGAMVQYSPIQNTVLAIGGLVASAVDSHISISGPHGFSGGLGNSGLYKIEGSADYALTKNIHTNIEIDYTSFKYGASTVYNGYYEPNSKSRYTTVKAGIGYSF